MTDFRSKRRFDAPLSRLGTLGPFHVMVALAVAYAVLLTLYLVSDLALVLVVLVAVVAGGTDRLVRLHPQARFHGPTATVLYLFLPGLFALFSALATGQVDNTALRLLLGAVSVVLFGITVIAEYLTVDPDAETYEVARFGLLLSIYVTALFAFIVALGGGFPLVAGVLLVGSVAFLLSVDMLRELEADAGALWIQSGAIAVVMAECRWVLHFLSLPDLLAGVFMLVVFYVMTGLIQDSVTGRMNRASWTTYGGVFAVASLFILFARLLT
ncbi:MAG: hypothetical protein AB7R89_10265 [Dehalococcoidia bacterium]